MFGSSKYRQWMPHPGLNKGKGRKPKIPPPPPPKPMVDDEAIARAKRKAQSRVRSRSGRDSTILGSATSDKADKLGG